MTINPRIILTILNIVILSLVYYIIVLSESSLPSFRYVSPYLSLGFLIIVAYLFGTLAKCIRLPSLTGNIAAGIVFGPPLLGLIGHRDIASLELINSLALSFIAIAAGGELRLSSLKKNGVVITGITVSHTLLILSGITGIFYLLFISFPLVAVESRQALIALALLLGTLALANSPASTLAIINEMKVKNDFTDIVLCVTMIKDTVVLISFAVMMSVVQSLYSAEPLSLHIVSEILISLVASGIAGIVFGAMMIWFFTYIAKEIAIFIVMASFLAHEFAHVVGLEHMFMCLVAGFTVQNFSRKGHLLIEAIEQSHLPIYVVFFSIAGAGLNFSYMWSSALVVILFVVIRAAFIQLSTGFSARLLNAGKSVQKYAWTGFVANAGLALSMLIVIEHRFSSWGDMFKAIFLSAIAINQIIGPVLFKWGINKSVMTGKNTG